MPVVSVSARTAPMHSLTGVERGVAFLACAVVAGPAARLAPSAAAGCRLGCCTRVVEWLMGLPDRWSPTPDWACPAPAP
jgi:hypothetical protein